MRLRRFEATTVTEALARAKAELGPEAVILHMQATGAAHEGRRVAVMAAVDEEPTTTGSPGQPPVAAADGAHRSGVGAARGGDPHSIQHTQRTGGSHGTGLLPTAAARMALGETLEIFQAGRQQPDVVPDALEDIRHLLMEVRSQVGPLPKLPAALRPAYRQLLSQEVPAGVARRMLLALPAEIRSRRKAPDAATLREMLARGFRVSGPILPGRRQRAVALVGPTGVGKTTTIAKLAGQCRHLGGLTVALISLDTYRIGAVAQMRIYADLLGVPLHVVRNPGEMRAALRAARNADLLLVDTMGRSPCQAEGIAAIRRLLREIPDLEVHLVVSATTKGNDLAEILRRFRPLQYGRILVSKLDEARTHGPLLSLVLERALVVSYLGTGQEVPDDLEAATARRLAALLVPEGFEGRRPMAATARGDHAG